jgi:hypothetical protein
MNSFLLLKAKAAILADPDHYSQNVWDCRTAACIVGWVGRLIGEPLHLICSDFRYDRAHFDIAAALVQKSLKLDDAQWKRLVDIHRWPKEFREGACVLGDTPKERAITAGKRIDRFVATKGEE